MKKTVYALILLLIAALELTGCAAKGMTKEMQEEVDEVLKDYREKIVDITWHEAEYPTSALRFFSDGRVEEIEYSTVFLRGVSSAEEGWILEFSDEYRGYRNWKMEDIPRKELEENFDYYIHFYSPMRSDHHYYHIPISFDEEGNLYCWDRKYVKGLDYIEEIPEDTFVDDYFTQTVWEIDDSGKYWIMWDDGWGAETVGTYNGELIYPTYFQWAFKDDLLYIDWYVTEDSNIDIDAYVIEKGELNFQMTHYWETDDSYHMVPSGDIDIMSFMH